MRFECCFTMVAIIFAHVLYFNFVVFSPAHQFSTTLGNTIQLHSPRHTKILMLVVDLFCWQVFLHKASLVAFHYPLLINVSPRAQSVL